MNLILANLKTSGQRGTAKTISNLVMVMLLALSMPTTAKELFTLDGVMYTDASKQTASFSSKTIQGLADALSNSGLSSIFPQYTDVSAVDVTLSIRGLPAEAAYRANSTALRFLVPSQGIDITFRGKTRDDSQQQLKDFLKGNGSGILTKLLQGMAANSPVDPVAGNPNSLQGQMGASTFGAATGIGTLSDPGSTRPSGGAAGTWTVPNLVAIGGDIGIADSHGYKSTMITLPIRYSLYFEDPRYALTFDLPLTYVDTEGAKTGLGSFGLALRVPILENWYLTPSARVGAAGSLDLGAAAVMYSGDLTSLYNLYLGDFKLSIGNGVGYYKTSKLSYSDVTIDYDLQNTALKNGLAIEGPLGFTLLGHPTSWQAYITDTQMFGDKLYIEHYDEVGFLMGSRERMDGQAWDSLRLGLSWTAGDKYNAVKANFQYRF